MRQYLLLFILFLTPVTVFAEHFSQCYYSDNFSIQLHYDTSKQHKFGKNHELFISDNNSNVKLSLTGEVILKNKKFSSIKYTYDNRTYIIESLNPQEIIIDDKKYPLNKDECFSFYASYDTMRNSEGELISILSAGKLYSKDLLTKPYKPYVYCDNALLSIDKAICSNNETSFLDNLFFSQKKCFMERALSLNSKDKDTVYHINSVSNSFLSYRNGLYKSNTGKFTEKELHDINMAYMLGIIFLPMTVVADNNNLCVLGKDMVLSYYTLSNLGIHYEDVCKTGLSKRNIVKSLYGVYYDELMFYHANVYDHLDGSLSNLFYYIVYLYEKYGIIDEKGKYICK